MAASARLRQAFDRLELRLDRAAATPLHRQIRARLQDAIARGLLAPGERLPSARSLASQLAVARGTVDLAYGLLAGEG
jgi:GntR family transcriptional regulator / MocR family aminotransferase